MLIELSQYKVTINDSLTWGDREQVNMVLASGAKIDGVGLSGFDATKMLEAKFKLLELAVVSIQDAQGTETKFAREWMNALSMEDGDKLYDAVEALNKKK